MIAMKKALYALPFLCLTACYFEAPSTDLKQYQLAHPNHAHSPQIQMLFNDFKGLSTETLTTNAIPLKIAVTALVMKRHKEKGSELHRRVFNEALKEYGFIIPEKIENLEEGTPAPDFKYPLGLIRGDLVMSLPTGGKIKAELGNITCAVCHGGRSYDSKGFPTKNVWLGLPNTSINLQSYTEEIYSSLKFIRDKKSEFLAAMKTVYPEMDALEEKSAKKFMFDETARSIGEFEAGSDTVLSFFNGPPGGANAIGSFKRVFKIYYPGYFTALDRGFVNIPDLGYRNFRSNLTVDGIYTLLGETKQSPITESQATLARSKELGIVAAIFPIPVMGVTAKRTEGNIEIMKEVFGNFIYNYRAPKFPGEISSAKALIGEKIYQTSCQGCHGQYSALDSAKVTFPRLISYPNKVISVEKIGTDTARIEAITPALEKKMSNSWIGKKLQTELHNGYMAPILSALWATAPYLHNGAVPTLWAMLNPELRPETFYVGGHALDFENVGITYPEGYTPWSKPIKIDTREKGLSNKGHESQFQRLSQDDKRSLLEYLKLL